MQTSASKRKKITALALLVSFAAVPILAQADHISPKIQLGSITVELEVVAKGLVHPVKIVHAGDGSDRLFIVDQAGVVRIVDGGVLLETPFVDVTDQLPALNTFFDERGLLGMAFHPDYENNGRFFMRYSRPRPGSSSEDCWNSSRGCHREIVAEFAVTQDPNVADPNPTAIIFEVDQPEFNHDGGDIGFGPDGYLYFAFGDGGGANDRLDSPTLPHGEIGNGQDVQGPLQMTTIAALGAMLRIDVDSADPFDPANVPYGIPADNPFVSADPEVDADESFGMDEIHSYGYRNPFRFSWDREDGRLFVADVGQGLFEEVNIVEKGGNYGWVTREGYHCFDPFDNSTPPASCASTGQFGEPLIDPVTEYDHGDAISITGGNVYRGGVSPLLVGKYIFGDFSRSFAPADGRIFYIDSNGASPIPIFEFRLKDRGLPLGEYVIGFGEGEDGEVYVGTTIDLAPIGTSGIVYRIVESFDTDEDGAPDATDNCSQEANPDQTDSDDDGFGNRCDPDLNQDDVVNFLDMGIMGAAYFTSPGDPNWNPDADLNADDIVNGDDVQIMREYFFGAPGPGVAGSD